MRNKIIAIIFVLCIFAAGIGTVIKAAPYVKEDTKEKTYTEISDTLDTTYTNRFVLRRNWVNINGLFLRTLGKTFVENDEADVYKMNNGMLTYGVDQLPDEDLDWYASQVADLSKDFPVLYVSLPFKIRNGDNLLPTGVKEYANSNANVMMSNIRAFDVDSIDLRDNFKELTENDAERYYRLFYRTDQHWTNKASLFAASTIADYLSKNYGFKYSKKTYETNNYDVKTYSNWFLGSFGKKTGSWYDGTDDYDLVIPSYDTEFTFEADSETGKITRHGSFENALLDKNNLEKELFRNNTYETYTGGNYKLTKVINKKNKNGKKLLLIRDSFSCSMMPFLSLACHEVDAIDPRSFDQSSIYEYAKKGNFDAVVIAYNPTIYGDKAFTFK